MSKSLMTHFYYGDPSEVFSLALARTLIESGVDIIEIGIPYTDPVCDGEIFQNACKRAINNGINPFKVIEGIKKIKDKRYGDKRDNIPIYLTSYYGPIFKIGPEKFVKKSKEAGVKGLIIPDLLLEEQNKLRKYCDKFNLSLIQFATVYSTEERLREIIRASTDFIYCISLPGVTGDSNKRILSGVEELPKLLRLLRSLTDKKIYVGFGISLGKDAERIIRMGADGIIVGSAIAKIYEKNPDNPFSTLPEISKFIKHLKENKIRKKGII